MDVPTLEYAVRTVEAWPLTAILGRYSRGWRPPRPELIVERFQKNDYPNYIDDGCIAYGDVKAVGSFILQRGDGADWSLEVYDDYIE